jgi:PKD repeat protein
MNNYIYGPPTWTEPWPTVPFNSARLWDTYTEWRFLQPTATTWDWSNLDWWLNQASQHNVELMYTFGGVPQWASSDPGNTNCHRALTSGALGSCAPPTDLTLWDNFVKAVVTHANGKIKYWELWNEPNIKSYWTGTPEQLATMAQHAYGIIKSIYPNAVVIGPSPSGYCYNNVCAKPGTSDGPTWLANFMSAGGSANVDIYGFHGYPGSVAESINSYLDHYQAVLSAANQSSKPLWDTEGSWGSQPPATVEMESAYLVRRFLLERSRGVARFYWEAWDANGNWGTLWDAANGMNNVGTAYAQVHQWLIGNTLSPCTQDLSGTFTCTLTRSTSYQAQVVWNPGNPIGYVPGTEFTTYRNMYGTQSNIAGAVTVGPDPILLETPASGNIAPQAVLQVKSAGTNTVSFTAPSGYVPFTVSADSSASYSLAGTIASRSIDFGDGTSTTSTSANHTYSTAGNYTITLTLADTAGATAHLTHAVPVYQPYCTLNPASPSLTLCTPANNATVSSPLHVVGIANDSNPIKNIAAYIDWIKVQQVNNSSTFDQSVAVPSGTHELSVEVTNSAGGKYWISETIHVN